MNRVRPTLSAVFALTVLILSGSAWALEPPAGDTPAEQLAYDDPGMYILNYYEPLDALPAALRQIVEVDLSALGVAPSAGFYDLRADKWGSLVLRVPLVPGAGVGNTLTWGDLGLAEPAGTDELGQAARAAFESFLAGFESQLKIDPAEIGSAQVTVHEDGRLIQINLGRVVGGTPVDGSWVHGVLNNGNLVLYGTRNWGEIDMSTSPTVTRSQAIDAVTVYTAPAGPVTEMRSPMLKLFPMKVGDTPSVANLGSGFDYRLTWEVQLSLADSDGTWRALVDAQSGELYSFADQNRYATRKVTGGVQPISNDGLSSETGVPDGVEQPGWPMPFADIWINQPPGSGTPDAVTNSSGVLSCVDGSISTRLAGPYVRMNDNCGPTNATVGAGDLDLGAGATAGLAAWMPAWGTDCARPLAGSSAGNTHSSRDGFYEVNRIKEQARGWLPDNFWLTGQLTANMNINNNCNAFWDGSTINFYRDQNSTCRNTGEEAAVFDHEWGHGMDANDAFAGVSTPGETTADQFAIYRLATSCIGRGFFKSGPCGGFGDPCLAPCSGVRETDYARHASGMPHNVSWIKQATVTPVDGPIAPRGGCVGNVAVPVLQTGPCLQATHCEGQIVSEAVWDLIERDLAGFGGSAFNFDRNTRLNLVTRLGYLGGGNVNFWFQCVDTPEDGTAGCAADGGYLNFLAADDDNGDLSDGTPRMSAIHAAFSRHQIACPTPAVVDSGCAAPPATPSLTATALDNGAQVTWGAVAGATEYWLFRSDGINGCEFGKERIAITTDTQYVDDQLLNGRAYYYTVEAVGGTESCRSAASVCEEVIPVAGANLKIREGSITTSIPSGDGDSFLDNCETAQVDLELENNGNVPLTNVQIVSIESPSHPAVVAAEALPIDVAASLTDCITAPASFSFDAQGLSFGDTLLLRVGFTADEFGGTVRTETIAIQNAESDFVPTASHTFDFNSDLGGWEIVVGNYDQLPGGPTADPAGSYLASSAFLPDQCDAIQSPLIELEAGSTLSLWNQYDTEPPLPVFGGTFYDRANVGLLDPSNGVRTTIVPDGGRLYDIPDGQAAGGSCFTTGERGWSDAGQAPFEESTWSPAALQTGSFAGKVVRLHVAYGTDPLVQGGGFQFDYVTLTDFRMQGADVQPDVCGSVPDAFPDVATTGFETAADIDVLANDIANGTGLTIVDVTDPPNGTATHDGTTITYTPDPGFVGVDVFSYTACNDSGGCDTATVTVTVQCPPEPSGGFADDFDPSAEPGWTVETPVNTVGDLVSPEWAVVADGSAHSAPNSYFSDATTLEQKDDRLVTPPLDVSATSELTFWHRYGFEDDGATTGYDGGVLEVSTNGGTSWDDVVLGGGSFVAGGYTHTIDATFGSAIAGRAAWSGGSTADPMSQVIVDIGAFAGDGVLFRWRLVTDPAALGSVPGEGWYVDTVEFTNLNIVPETCSQTPVANDDAYSVDEGDTLNVAAPGVLGNDIDDGPLTAVVGSPPGAAASFSFNSDGSFDYTHDGSGCPGTGGSEDDSFTYQADDGAELSNFATVTIDVVCAPVNNPPTANNDAYGVDDDDTLSVAAPGVLGNDTDPDPGDVLEAELIPGTGPTAGTLDMFAPDGSFTYTPDDSCGDTSDSFNYLACDRASGDPDRECDNARVDINISDANLPPTPQDDAATTPADTAIDIDVFADNGSGADSDPDAGDTFTIVAVTAPGNGSAVHNPPPDGNITYTPNTGFNGTDTFTYSICDQCGLCADATVTVTVGSPNQTPEPMDDTATTPEDTAITIDVLDNDVEPDGDPMTVTSATDPPNGSVVVNTPGPDNDVTYTPDANFFGTDGFDYTVCDDNGACATASVTVTVEPDNTNPGAADDSYTTAEDTALVVPAPGVLSNDTDPDSGDTLEASGPTSGPGNGSVALAADGSFTYTPDPDFNGSDSFVYQVCDRPAGDPDRLCDQATVSITVDPVDDDPVADDDSATTSEGVAVDIDVLANDSDPDGDPLTVGAGTDGTSAGGGTVTNNGGDVTYTPAAGFTGTDTFTYEACDAAPPCATATVTVTVNPTGADNVPDGVQALYLTSGTVDQPVPSLAEGQECLFRMWVGKRSDGQGTFGRWFVQLATDDWYIQNVLHGRLDEQTAGWQQYEATFTVQQFPTSPIKLRLLGEAGFTTIDMVELYCDGSSNLLAAISFEDPPTADGTWSAGDPTGWTLTTGGGGVFNPDGDQMNPFSF